LNACPYRAKSVLHRRPLGWSMKATTILTRGGPMWVDDRDNVILKVLFNYFSAVAEVFHREWTDGACPLARTIGFGALMSLLGDLVPAGLKGGDLPEAFFAKEVGKIRRGYEKLGPELTFENFPAAGNGETKLLRQLREWAQAAT